MNQPQWVQDPSGQWHAVQPQQQQAPVVVKNDGCLKAFAVLFAIFVVFPIVAVIGITILGAVSGPSSTTTTRVPVTTTR